MRLTFKLHPLRTILFCATNLLGFLIIQRWLSSPAGVRLAEASTKNLTKLAKLMDRYVASRGQFPPIGEPLEYALMTSDGPPSMTYKDPINGDMLPISFNNKLRGLKRSDIPLPQQTVVFYMPSFSDDSPGLIASFANGEVSHVPYSALGQLVWDPKAK